MRTIRNEWHDDLNLVGLQAELVAGPVHCIARHIPFNLYRVQNGFESSVLVWLPDSAFGNTND